MFTPKILFNSLNVFDYLNVLINQKDFKLNSLEFKLFITNNIVKKNYRNAKTESILTELH